jgi:predicted MFS family arabinose efflux permease
MAAMRTLPFWQLVLGFFSCGFAITLISTHFIPFATDFGLSRPVSGQLFGLMGAMSILGSLGTGWISDRVGRRLPLAGVYLLRAASLLLLSMAQTATDFWIFAVLFGLCWAAPFPLTSAFTGDLWGKRAMATIFGMMFFIHLIGDALGAYIGGLVFDLTSSYTPVLTLAALMATLGGVSVLSIRWRPKQEVAFVTTQAAITSAVSDAGGVGGKSQ